MDLQNAHYLVENIFKIVFNLLRQAKIGVFTNLTVIFDMIFNCLIQSWQVFSVVKNMETY